MVNESEVQEMLQGVKPGAVVFVSYLAGRPCTERAQREAERAAREGLARRHFFGTLTDAWTTKKGQFVFRVLCDNRDDERRQTNNGYRTFNANLGRLLTFEVVQP